tara:strand:+ start:195 stop:1421 length:1227 start_codon:yes stop_codon:yes gene_type:complete
MKYTVQELITSIDELITMPNLLLIILIVLIFVLIVEISHSLRAYSPLQLKVYDHKLVSREKGLTISSWIEIKNPHPRMEVMIPEMKVKPKLLGKEGVNDLIIKTTLDSFHPDQEARKDGYWQAYIVKSNKSTKIKISIEIEDSDKLQAISIVENIWIDILWVNYGPFGRLNLRDGSIIPIKIPEPLTPENAYFNQYKQCQILPIKTHLLGSNDDIVEVINRYVMPIINPGDILTIGETPLAIIQGRYTHPNNIKPELLTKIICRAFHPTSSLATACGLQALINIVGPSRVLFSFLIGLAGKLIGIKGLFYRLAGEQARLIDDITGTTAPYDQTIVLGPERSKNLCQNISKQLGIQLAVVDVNDLGRVKILTASDPSQIRFLKKALQKNPAGNADEQTPLVLIRPYKPN